ncbi:MAG: hypothetical protein U1E05_14505, partial [Patescibacteria group bacterium]|nr:hypothetical protein [Patescibacteria group bacterium]
MRSDPVRADVPAEHGGGSGAPASSQEVRPLLAKGRKPKHFWKKGEPFVWLSGAALATTVALTGALLLVVLVNGLPVFWPTPIAEVRRLVAVVDRDGSLRAKVEREAQGVRKALDRHAALPAGAAVNADGAILLPMGASVSPSGEIALAVHPDATLPLLAGQDVPADDLLVTVPLVRSAEELPTPEPGERAAEVADDGRAFTTLLGEYVERQVNRETEVVNVKYKTGNREYGPAFRWVAANAIGAIEYPLDAFVLERIENLNYYGRLTRLHTPGFVLPAADTPADQLAAALAAAQGEFRAKVEPIKREEERVAAELRRSIKYDILRAEFQLSQLAEQGQADSSQAKSTAARLAGLREREQKLLAESDQITLRRVEQERQVRENVGIFTSATGQETPIALVDIVRAYRPNRMGFGQKAGHYLAKVWELLSADPREANQDGGLFPAIFGTVLLVFL